MESDELQQALLEEAYNTGAGPDWTALASKLGMELSADEAEAYLDDILGGDYELSEFELELVAAASSTQCGNLGT